MFATPVLSPEYTRVMRATPLRLALPLILALAAACTPRPEPEGPRIQTAEDLLTALRDAGAEVGETAMLAWMPGLASGRVVFIGSERVEIYEQESEAAQRRAVQQLLERASGETTPNLWGNGRLIVIYDGLHGPTIALLSGLLGDRASLSAPSAEEPYPPAVAAAIGWLAESTGVDPGEVIVESFQAAEWPDGCLGLAQAEEACLAVITLGWRVQLQIGTEAYTLRSNELGTAIRQEP
ncbi:MAG TPA: hypothetical protein VI701_06115 [Anaerolineales bacterium]|nr:hypothetical protein [Anaerolineales bacterium]